MLFKAGVYLHKRKVVTVLLLFVYSVIEFINLVSIQSDRLPQKAVTV